MKQFIKQTSDGALS